MRYQCWHADLCCARGDACGRYRAGSDIVASKQETTGGNVSECRVGRQRDVPS